MRALSQIYVLGVWIYRHSRKLAKTQTLTNLSEEVKNNYISKFGLLWGKDNQPYCLTHKTLLHSYSWHALSYNKWGFICSGKAQGHILIMKFQVLY